MKRGKMIKTAIMLTMLCVAAWRMPDIIERVESMREQSPLGMLSGLDPSLAIAAPGEQNQRSRRGQGVIVITPRGGQEITPEEEARLRAEARRLAPLRIDDDEPQPKPATPATDPNEEPAPEPPSEGETPDIDVEELVRTLRDRLPIPNR